MERKFKTTILLITAVLALGVLVSSCGKKADKIEIALIPTEKSRLMDGTFNQGTYEGIQAYADSRNINYKVYEPESKDVEDYLKAIDSAISEGAKIVVTPGFNFETAIFIAQDKYPDVDFILLDAVPNNGNYENFETKIAGNTYAVLFAEEQAGFLAGYAIVKDGFKNLAFFGGMECCSVANYGYGFIQGAEYAAKELGLEKGEVTIKYDYAGNFSPTPENQSKASSYHTIPITLLSSHHL